MKLYTSSRDPGVAAQWYLAELRKEDKVDIKHTEMDKHKSQDALYTRINPFAITTAVSLQWLPGFQDDGGNPLFESSAILMYVAQRFSEDPRYASPEGRAEAAKWLSFSETTLVEVLFSSQHDILFSKPQEEMLQEILAVLDGLLSRQPYLEGEGLTLGVADVATTFTLLCAASFATPETTSTLASCPAITAYMNRLTSSPAAQATLGARGVIKPWTELMAQGARPSLQGTSPASTKATAAATPAKNLASDHEPTSFETTSTSQAPAPSPPPPAAAAPPPAAAAAAAPPPAAAAAPPPAAAAAPPPPAAAAGAAGSNTGVTGQPTAEVGPSEAAQAYRFVAAAGPDAPLLLYGAPMTRSWVVEWLLEELGVGGQVGVVNMDFHGAREHKRNLDFLRVNPFGRVPALMIGAQPLFEMGAIALYLAERFPDAPGGGLGSTAPATSSSSSCMDSAFAYARSMQWVLFSQTSLYQAMFIKPQKDKLPQRFKTLDGLLSSRHYLHGDGSSFGVEDLMVGATLFYYAAMKPDPEEAQLQPHPALVAYMERLGSRPALLSRYPREVWAAALAGD